MKEKRGEDDDIAPTEDVPSALNEPLTQPEEKERQCTKIYFASRTHSQLEQFLREIQVMIILR